MMLCQFSRDSRTRSIWMALLALILKTTVSQADGPSAVLVHLFDGDVVSGTSIEWSAVDPVTVVSTLGKSHIARERIDTIEFSYQDDLKTNETSAVRLSNGDLIFGTNPVFHDDQITIRRGDSDIVIPVVFVNSIAFRTTPESYRFEELAVEDRDSVRLSNSDLLKGDLVEMTVTTAVVESEVGKLTLPISRIKLIQMNPNLIVESEIQFAIARVYLRDGSIFRIQNFKKAHEDSRCQMTILSELEFETDIKEILRIEMLGDAVLTRPEIKVVSHDSQDFFGNRLPVMIDQDAERHQIRTESRVFAAGFGVRATSQLSLFVPENATAFSVVAGFTESSKTSGSVIIRLKQSDRELLTKTLDSRTLPSLRIRNIPLTQGIPLELIVEYGKRADVGDSINWCRPVFHLRN